MKPYKYKRLIIIYVKYIVTNQIFLSFLQFQILMNNIKKKKKSYYLKQHLKEYIYIFLTANCFDVFIIFISFTHLLNKIRYCLNLP